MASRVKTLVQTGMLLLTLGFSLPSSICSAAPAPEMKSSCCADSASCHCLPATPCTDLCKINPTHRDTRDLVAAARCAAALPRVEIAWFTLAPVRDLDRVPAAVLHRRELNASPPFGGSPPQAYLRLWLI